MKDFYGKELAVGDNVLWAGGYRGSVMRQGIIERITDDYSVIRCYRAHGNEVNRSKFIDLNTGKFINPSNVKHQKEKAGWYHIDTGNIIDSDNVYYRHTVVDDTSAPRNLWGHYPSKKIENPNYVPAEKREWRNSVLHDHIQEIKLLGGYAYTVRDGDKIARIPVEL